MKPLNIHTPIVLFFILSLCFLSTGCYVRGSITEIESHLSSKSPSENTTTSSTLPSTGTTTTSTSTTTTTTLPLTPNVNPVTSLSGDIANNSLDRTPTFTFNYTTTGNTYSFGNFEISIGSTIGATNILNWTSIASLQTFMREGLVLTQDTDYFVNVRAKDSMGNVSTSVSRSWRAVASVTVSARFAAAANWMDYVKVSNTAQACDNTISGYYNCLHGGEKKTITVVGENSCSGLTAYDALDVFTWTCVSGAPVSFITKEVKSGKGLKDLVTVSGWINNRVFVIKNGNPLKASTYTTWWTNPVSALPTSLGPATNTDIGAISGTIYVVGADQTSFGYNILSNKTAVVVKSTATLKLSPSTVDNCTLPFKYDPSTCLFMGSANSELGSYSWFEGSFSANGNTSGILWIAGMATHFVLNESQVFGFRHAMYGSIISNLIRGNTFALNTAGFAYAENSIKSVYLNNKFINSFLELSDGSQYNIINRNIIFSNFGIDIPINNNNIIANNTISTSGGVNLAILASASRNTIHNFLNMSELVLISSSDQTTLSHIVSDRFTVSGAFSTNFKISGNLAMNTCNIALAPNDGINSSCNLIAPSNGSIVNIASPSNSFLGKITSDSNFSGYNSVAGIDYSAILNFTKFDNFFTGWLDSTNMSCGSGDTCFLYSSKLKSTDSVILNKSGNLSTTNASFPALSTDPCPAEVHGNMTATDQATTPNTYLLNAMEIIGDEIGDDNGLCESNETCIYTPNIGAYQGEGDYTTKTCSFQNGTVTGVTIFAYPNNGG